MRYLTEKEQRVMARALRRSSKEVTMSDDPKKAPEPMPDDHDPDRVPGHPEPPPAPQPEPEAPPAA